MKTVKLIVNTNNHKYPIIIGSGIINKLSNVLENNGVRFHKCLLIIDNKIPKSLIDKTLSSFLKKKVHFFFLMLMKKIKVSQVLIEY